MTISIKRVVTGVDAKGTSIAYEDAPMPPTELALMPGVQMFQLWGTEGALKSPVTDPKANNHTFFPGPGGTRFGLFRFPPASEAPANAAPPDPAVLEAGVAEAEAKVPGLLAAFEPANPGMHQTKTIDYLIVVEGDMWMELDNGKEVHLPVGTCIVQNGARHGWRNHGKTPGTLAYVILAV